MVNINFIGQRAKEEQRIVLIFPVIKRGTEFATSAVGHQFKCKPRTRLPKLFDGFCDTGSVTLVPLHNKRKKFEDRGDILCFICKNSSKPLNQVT